MMTKIAHIRENRKNNKGFSLVELIIVIAIMVALIAVMGPQYVKYVQSSRDAVVGDAAESLLSVVKSEYAMNNLTGTGTIVISAQSSNGPVVFALNGVTKGANAPSGYKLSDVASIDSAKTVKSEVVYTINIAASSVADGAYDITMTKTGNVVTAMSDFT